MACLDKETATAYLRGDLDPHEAGLCAAHIATCDACRQIVEEISALMDFGRDALRELEDSSDAPDWSHIGRVIDRAIAKKPEREPAREPGDQPEHPRWRSGWHPSWLSSRPRSWPSSWPRNLPSTWPGRLTARRWLALASVVVSVMFVAVLGAFVYEQRHAGDGSPAPASGPPPVRPRAMATPPVVPPAVVPAPGAPVRTLSRAAQLALEVRALSLLDEAGALLGEQVNVRRTPAGVRVEVTVDSEQRRLEIARALAPIVGAPGVGIRLQTFASEAKRRPKTAAQVQAPLTLREVGVQRDEFPAATLVRDALRAGHPEKDAGEIERETRLVAARATEQSQLALQHAWAVERLASRYAPETEASLPAAARETWHAMIRLHAREVAARATGLGETIAPLLHDSTVAPPPSPEAARPDPRERTRVASRLVALAQAEDEIVRGAFSATAVATNTVSIGSSEFRSTWQELVRLAQQLAE